MAELSKVTQWQAMDLDELVSRRYERLMSYGISS